MTIQIDQLPLGQLQTNCYIVGDTETGEALIIDPSAEGERILAKVAERGYTVREIIATHAHFDHVIASGTVKKALNVPFRLHEEAVPMLARTEERAAAYGIPMADPPAQADGYIAHGDVVEVGGIRLEARYTPGHAPGHLIFVLEGEALAFVGDCIFNMGIGRTDLPGGDTATLKHSIQQHILTLPDDCVLLSGHGPQTTVGREKRESYFLADLLSFPG